MVSTVHAKKKKRLTKHILLNSLTLGLFEFEKNLDVSIFYNRMSPVKRKFNNLKCNNIV